MERVIPWPGDGPGYVNLHWVKDKKWKGRPFKDVASFMDMAQWLALKASIADDVYYCMTVQSQTGKVIHGKVSAVRSAPNATLVKAIWLDVDVKPPPKGYATIPEALNAIAQFVHAAQIPNPSALVLSGGGVHVYWIFDRPLSIAEWRPYAEGLKAEAQRVGLLADYGVTADPARVLRVPGTFNRKLKDNPRAVKVAALGFDCTEAELAGLAALGATKAAAVTAAVTHTPLTAQYDMTLFKGWTPPAEFAVLNAATDNLSDGMNLRSDLPLDPTETIKHCGHYRDAFVNGGRGHGQGLWHLTVLGTTWFENGRDFAHKMSKGYPTYDPAETDAMFDRKLTDKSGGKLGWPSCNAFASEGCVACKTCPLKGKIKSPLHLAERIAPPPELAAQAQAPAAPEDLQLPAGFTVDPATGIICYILQTEGKDGVLFTDLKPLFYGKVSSQWTQGGKEPRLHFTYVNGPHTDEITVPYAVMANDMALGKCLSEQTCMSRNEKYVREFMKAWVSQIDEAHRRQISAPFGWIVEGDKRRGFAYGGSIFKPNGTTEAAGHPDRELQATYTPAGDDRAMQRLLTILHEQNHPALETITLQAFASPLLFVMGQKSAVAWAWSNAGGAHKSTSLLTGMGVWSAPGKTKENAMGTIVGLQLKLAQLQHLPIYIDEIAEREEVAKLRPQIRIATEGGGGSKGRRNLTLADKPTWQAIICCGANQSMRESLAEHNATTDAGPTRVFEFKVAKRAPMHDGHEVDLLVDALDHNYGHIGLAYAKYIAEHVTELKDRADVLDAEIVAAVAPYNSEQRFWKCTVAVTLLAAETANKVLGRDIFHLDALRAFLIETYIENRDWVQDNMKIGGTVGQAEEVMGNFLNHVMNNQLWTPDMYKGGGRPAPLTIYKRPPENAGRGNPVHIHWCVNDRLMQIAYPALSEFISGLENYSAKSTITNLVKHFNGIVKKRINMTAGVSILTRLECDVIEIPVPAGSVLEPMLQSQTPAGSPPPPNAGLTQAPATP